MESTLTPSTSQASRTRLIARTPARWPKLAGLPRRRAQRPLPSMMIPMWRGIRSSKIEQSVPVGFTPVGPDYPGFRAGQLPDSPDYPGGRLRSDLHDFLFFASGKPVDALDLGFGDLLQARVGSLGIILGNLAILLQLVDAVQLVAPDVPDRDPRLFRLLPDELHVLAAALLGQGRDGHADHLAVAGRVQPLLA